MNSPTSPTIDSIPVAKTPPGGWTEWPAPILVGCREPRPEGAPDLDGYWQTIEVTVNDQVVPDHPSVGGVTRVEQAGDRLVAIGGGVVHDMRCDGTLENGVHDVAEFDKRTEINVAASYEDGVHVLRPEGMNLEVRRWREGEHLIWDYARFVARMRRLGSSDLDPSEVFAAIANP